MPKYFDEDGNEVDPTSEPLNPNIREQIRKAEKLADELAEANKKLAQFEAEGLFDAAGIPKDGSAKWFRKGYDGPKDVESIRAAATADGLLKPATADTDPADTQLNAELEELRKAQGATVGHGGTSPDPAAELNQRMQKATTPAEILELLEEAKAKGLQTGVRIAH